MTGAAIRIRPYRPTDVTCLIALFRDTVRRVNRRRYGPRQVRAWAPETIDVAAWSQRLTAHTSFVAARGSRVLGFAELAADGCVDTLYVHARWQAQGIGSRLLAAVEAAARTHRLAQLYAAASLSAEGFFAAHGFRLRRRQIVELRGVGFRNAVMIKPLAPPRRPRPGLTWRTA
ncbi:GNAT family acetyltransferase [Plasticicumulans lactativorans]|uniref:GNAT family acetyltransferase n=1 Tax=Plasticicumulans lactativorans TaxID=1133106 RepID=A0A4R2LHX6_9GAMM|nr:GNAT family N-acetyltransferase [Plasticicumulans lactativorans]TCO82741.1 GNAT family acetyltransferase [Plasticicumulans lactativorans]